MKRLIAEYYPRVDAGDLDWVIGLFSDDAVYVRADAEYAGKPAIEAFYRGDRKIGGRHTIQGLFESGDTVAVQGVFCGVGADGSPRDIRFSDFWHFRQVKVVARDTYLALGSDYVRD